MAKELRGQIADSRDSVFLTHIRRHRDYMRTSENGVTSKQTEYHSYSSFKTNAERTKHDERASNVSYAQTEKFDAFLADSSAVVDITIKHDGEEENDEPMSPLLPKTALFESIDDTFEKKDKVVPEREENSPPSIADNIILDDEDELTVSRSKEKGPSSNKSIGSLYAEAKQLRERLASARSLRSSMDSVLASSFLATIPGVVYDQDEDKKVSDEDAKETVNDEARINGQEVNDDAIKELMKEDDDSKINGNAKELIENNDDDEQKVNLKTTLNEEREKKLSTKADTNEPEEEAKKEEVYPHEEEEEEEDQRNNDDVDESRIFYEQSFSVLPDVNEESFSVLDLNDTYKKGNREAQLHHQEEDAAVEGGKDDDEVSFGTKELDARAQSLIGVHQSNVNWFKKFAAELEVKYEQASKEGEVTLKEANLRHREKMASLKASYIHLSEQLDVIMAEMRCKQRKITENHNEALALVRIQTSRESAEIEQMIFESEVKFRADRHMKQKKAEESNTHLTNAHIEEMYSFKFEHSNRMNQLNTRLLKSKEQGSEMQASEAKKYKELIRNLVTATELSKTDIVARIDVIKARIKECNEAYEEEIKSIEYGVNEMYGELVEAVGSVSTTQTALKTELDDAITSLKTAYLLERGSEASQDESVEETQELERTWNLGFSPVGPSRSRQTHRRWGSSYKGSNFSRLDFEQSAVLSRNRSANNVISSDHRTSSLSRVDTQSATLKNNLPSDKQSSRTWRTDSPSRVDREYSRLVTNSSPPRPSYSRPSRTYSLSRVDADNSNPRVSSRVHQGQSTANQSRANTIVGEQSQYPRPIRTNSLSRVDSLNARPVRIPKLSQAHDRSATNLSRIDDNTQSDQSSLPTQASAPTDAVHIASCDRSTSPSLPHSPTKVNSSLRTTCDGATSPSIPDIEQPVGSSQRSTCDGATSPFIPDTELPVGSSQRSTCDGATSPFIPVIENVPAKSFNTSAQHSTCDTSTSPFIPYSAHLSQRALKHATDAPSGTLPDHERRGRSVFRSISPPRLRAISLDSEIEALEVKPMDSFVSTSSQQHHRTENKTSPQSVKNEHRMYSVGYSMANNDDEDDDETEDIVANVFEKMRVFAKKKGGRLKIVEIFREFDLNQNGTLDALEMKQALKRIGVTDMSDKVVRAVMRAGDLNGDGMLDYKELLTMLRAPRLQDAAELSLLKEVSKENDDEINSGHDNNNDDEDGDEFEDKLENFSVSSEYALDDFSISTSSTHTFHVERAVDRRRPPLTKPLSLAERRARLRGNTRLAPMPTLAASSSSTSSMSASTKHPRNESSRKVPYSPRLGVLARETSFTVDEEGDYDSPASFLQSFDSKSNKDDSSDQGEFDNSSYRVEIEEDAENTEEEDDDEDSRNEASRYEEVGSSYRLEDDDEEENDDEEEEESEEGEDSRNEESRYKEVGSSYRLEDDDEEDNEEEEEAEPGQLSDQERSLTENMDPGSRSEEEDEEGTGERDSEVENEEAEDEDSKDPNYSYLNSLCNKSSDGDKAAVEEESLGLIDSLINDDDDDNGEDGEESGSDNIDVNYLQGLCDKSSSEYEEDDPSNRDSSRDESSSKPLTLAERKARARQSSTDNTSAAPTTDSSRDESSSKSLTLAERKARARQSSTDNTSAAPTVTSSIPSELEISDEEEEEASEYAVSDSHQDEEEESDDEEDEQEEEEEASEYAVSNSHQDEEEYQISLSEEDNEVEESEEDNEEEEEEEEEEDDYVVSSDSHISKPTKRSGNGSSSLSSAAPQGRGRTTQEMEALLASMQGSRRSGRSRSSSVGSHKSMDSVDSVWDRVRESVEDDDGIYRGFEKDKSKGRVNSNKFEKALETLLEPHAKGKRKLSFRTVMKKVNPTGSPWIEHKDLIEMLKGKGIYATKPERMLEELDVSGYSFDVAAELVWERMTMFGKMQGDLRALEVFREFDKDRSGKWSRSEFQAALERLQIKGVSPQLVKALIKSADPDGDGKLEYKEVLRKWKNALLKPPPTVFVSDDSGRSSSRSRPISAIQQPTKENKAAINVLSHIGGFIKKEGGLRMLDLFNEADKKNTGMIDAKSLKRVVEQTGLMVTPHEIEAVILYVDPQSNGQVIDFKLLLNKLVEFSVAAHSPSNLKKFNPRGKTRKRRSSKENPYYDDSSRDLSLDRLRMLEASEDSSRKKNDRQGRPEPNIESMMNRGKYTDEEDEEEEEDEEVLDEYAREREDRNKKRLLMHKMTELQSQIRVYARVKPFPDPKPGGKKPKVATFYDSNHDNALFVKRSPSQRSRYMVDKLFRQEATQDEVFCGTVKPLLLGFVTQGINVSVLAYGQGRSGKTYTMSGGNLNSRNYSGLETVLSGQSARDDTLQGDERDTVGLAYRAIRDMFNIINDEGDPSAYSFTLEFVEIYGDTVFDLLDDFGAPAPKEYRSRASSRASSKSSQPRRSLELREDLGETFVAGLSSNVITSAREAQAFIVHGENRRTGSSQNDRSNHSSTTLLTITCCRSTGHNSFSKMQDGYRSDSYDSDMSSLTEGTGMIKNKPSQRAKDLPTGDDYVVSRLHFVDLAGSEKVNKATVSADRFKVAQATNRSLASLGDVMSALNRNHNGASGHVPFRNSKLTYLLKSSLSESGRVALITTISPLIEDGNETINSLNFTARCKPKRGNDSYVSSLEPSEGPRKKYTDNRYLSF